jgi:hypothetical protein
MMILLPGTTLEKLELGDKAQGMFNGEVETKSQK